VLPEKGPAVLTSGSAPVECQKEIWLDEKFYTTIRLTCMNGGQEETYDLVSNIVPNIRHKLNLPLALPTHHPLQVGVAGSALAVDPSVLELREVAFEEADLVLVGRARYIGRRPLDREVVVHGARVDGCLSLRDQLRSPHIGIPFRGVVDRDLCALGRAGVCRVLVCGREIDVFGYCTGAVDVVLIVLRLWFNISEF
jgi:hypothetical protein